MLTCYLLVLGLGLIPLSCSTNVTSAVIRPSQCPYLSRGDVWLNTQFVNELERERLDQYMKFCCACVDDWFGSWFSTFLVPFSEYRTIYAEGDDRDDTFDVLSTKLAKHVRKAYRSNRNRVFVCTHVKGRKLVGLKLEKIHKMTCYIKKVKKMVQKTDEDITEVYSYFE